MLERVVANMAAAPKVASAHHKSPALPTTSSSNVVQLAAAPRVERLRALVVDDSPTVRLQLAKIVERIGLRCDAMESAEVALVSLASNRYNVIFVDVVMPDMDGYKLTREIKRDPRHKGTPVIILTSKSSPFDRARGSLAGCDTYLTKPVELRRLYEATAQCLGKSMAVSDLSDWISDPTRASAKPPLAVVSAASMATQNLSTFGELHTSLQRSSL
jgi:CheY-like chemotaxis protein